MVEMAGASSKRFGSDLTSAWKVVGLVLEALMRVIAVEEESCWVR